MIEEQRGGWLDTWRRHWADYAIEGALLGSFMVSACLAVAMLEYPGSPLRGAIADGFARRALIGVLMGATALAIFLSAWGKRTGAHMNPAVTLVFAWLGKTTVPNAVGYIAGQLIGGVGGVLLSSLLLGDVIRDPAINYIVTVPGTHGVLVAWVAEFIMSAAIIFTVLALSGIEGWAKATPYAAASLVCVFIVVEAPFSGMSINPARTLGSAIPANVWTAWWVYITAPVAGMFAGAGLRHLLAQCSHRRACCMGGRCNSCRCLYTCHRLRSRGQDLHLNPSISSSTETST